MLFDVTVWGLFIEGLVSFFSPCILPLVPLYMGYLTKDAKKTREDGTVYYDRLKTFVMTIGFVLGISTVFVIAAMSSDVIRLFILKYDAMFKIVGGCLLILMGLFHLKVIHIPFLERQYQKQLKPKGKASFISAWAFGFIFSFAWTPCVGPMLAQAIVLASSTSRVMGWIYIGAFTLGFILMFILLGIFTTTLLNLFQKYRNIVRYTTLLGGIIIVAMGGYMLYQGVSGYRPATSQSQSPTQSQNQASGKQDVATIEGFDFTLKNGKGEDVTLSSFKGKTIIVNFFGTWCEYCNEEMPVLQRIHDNDQDVQVLMIATPGHGGEGSQEYVEEYMQKKGYSLPILYDPDLSVTQKFLIRGYPSTYIIQPNGDFYGYVPGLAPEDKLLEFIEGAKQNGQKQ